MATKYLTSNVLVSPLSNQLIAEQDCTALKCLSPKQRFSGVKCTSGTIDALITRLTLYYDLSVLTTDKNFENISSTMLLNPAGKI